jgi:hypothetical protein
MVLLLNRKSKFKTGWALPPYELAVAKNDEK